MEYVICHHGIKGQKWGIRRYQNPDGTLTAEGKERYGIGKLQKFNDQAKFMQSRYKKHDKLLYKLSGIKKEKTIDEWKKDDTTGVLKGVENYVKDFYDEYGNKLAKMKMNYEKSVQNDYNKHYEQNETKSRFKDYIKYRFDNNLDGIDDFEDTFYNFNSFEHLNQKINYSSNTNKLEKEYLQQKADFDQKTKELANDIVQQIAPNKIYDFNYNSEQHSISNVKTAISKVTMHEINTAAKSLNSVNTTIEPSYIKEYERIYNNFMK